MTDSEKTFFEQLDEVDAILREANATMPTLSDIFDAEVCSIIDRQGFTLEPITENPYAEKFWEIDERYKDTSRPDSVVGWFWDIYFLWSNVRHEAQGMFVEPTRADMMKSCLLYRMMVEHKPPFPNPIPTHFSAPMYQWAEMAAEHGVQFVKKEGTMLIDGKNFDIEGDSWWAERPSGSIDGPMNLKSAMHIAEVEPGTTIHSSDPRGS